MRAVVHQPRYRIAVERERRPKASPSNNAAVYSDQAEGGRVSGKVTGSSGPGTDSVPGK